MKFSTATITATAFFATKALAGTLVRLYTETKDTANKHYGIVAKHGGAGFDNIYLNSEGSTQALHFDGTYNSLDSKAGHYNYHFYVEGNFAQLGVVQEPAEVIFDDAGYLTINGSSDGFFGCMNVNEPYNYSQTQYELLYKPEDISDCIALKLKAE